MFLPSNYLDYQAVGDSDYLFAYDNSTYNLNSIKANGTCTQLLTYQWGFSALLLVITLFLTTLWATSTYVLWLTAYFRSRFDNSQWDIGTYRAVLDLASAMDKEMSNGNDDTLGKLSNHELEKRIHDDIDGGRIGYENLDERGLGQTRATEIKSWWYAFRWRIWVREEKWWILAETIVLSLCIPLLRVTLFILLVGIMFARLVGRLVRTRALFIAFFFVLALACWKWSGRILPIGYEP